MHWAHKCGDTTVLQKLMDVGQLAPVLQNKNYFLENWKPFPCYADLDIFKQSLPFG